MALRTSGFVVPAVSALAMLAACTGSEPAGGLPQDGSADPATKPPTATVSPPPEPVGDELTSLVESAAPSLLASVADPTTRRTVERATQELIADCMADQGFDYVVRQPEQVTEPPDSILLGAFGLTDIEQARANGYYNPELAADVDLEPRSGEEAFTEALFGDPRAERILEEIVDPMTGTPIGMVEQRQGCVGQAEAAAYGGADVRLRYLALDAAMQEAALDTIAAAQASELFQMAEEAWSRCMTARGYAFDRLVDVAATEWAEPRPSDEEVNTAVTDVECKADSDLPAACENALVEAASARDTDFATLISEWTQLRGSVQEAALGQIAEN